MKKHLGILRNRHDRLAAFKQEAVRKKNRFQIVGKDDFDDVNGMPSPTQPLRSPPRIPIQPAPSNSQMKPMKHPTRQSSASNKSETR
jgi:hypothetical protein